MSRWSSAAWALMVGSGYKMWSTGPMGRRTQNLPLSITSPGCRLRRESAAGARAGVREAATGRRDEAPVVPVGVEYEPKQPVRRVVTHLREPRRRREAVAGIATARPDDELA